jgi:apolipoprotein N-acyltransferase
MEADGKIQGRYDKMHPVMFGEYVPLGETFPWLYRLTPMSGGLDAGAEARSFRLGSLRLAPSICYETVIPHLIRRQVNELRALGEEPDVLVNLTNDGWFYGSAELDMHLACGVFRAVECRKPLLIAANTGFSAWIDGDGRIRAQGPRHAEGIVLAEVRPDPRESGYLRWGDWPAGICLAACAVLAIAGAVRRGP